MCAANGQPALTAPVTVDMETLGLQVTLMNVVECSQGVRMNELLYKTMSYVYL